MRTYQLSSRAASTSSESIDERGIRDVEVGRVAHGGLDVARALRTVPRGRASTCSSPARPAMNSGCHWTPTASPCSSSIPSITPSAARAVARRPAPSRSTAWWWTLLTASGRAPEGPREPRAVFDLDLVHRPVPRLADVVLDIAGHAEVLDQRAAARDVQQLHAAAHPEDGQLPRDRAACETELEVVATRGWARSVAVERLGVVAAPARCRRRR